LSEEIITMLSNLGAIDEEKAVAVELLESSERLKHMVLDSEINKLIQSGYVKSIDGKLYLTRSGLLRALSRFS
jgi:DNA-binding IscR family transcriptional regulator